MIVGIHQPNFFPWIGYFVKIARSDKFVFLDDVQFPKKGGSYINRTEIIMGASRNWLTVPINRFHGTWKINQCTFSDLNWRNKIIKSLHLNYVKAPCFRSTSDFVFQLLEFETDNIAAFNMNAVNRICEQLKVRAEFCKSSELDLNNNDATQRLVEIVQKLDGNTYLSGRGGQKYQDDQIFVSNNISLIYNDFIHPEYNHHVTKNNEKGLSILDLIFSLGFENLIKVIHNE
jgi:hypothetical protein